MVEGKRIGCPLVGVVQAKTDIRCIDNNEIKYCCDQHSPNHRPGNGALWVGGFLPERGRGFKADKEQDGEQDTSEQPGRGHERWIECLQAIASISSLEDDSECQNEQGDDGQHKECEL